MLPQEPLIQALKRAILVDERVHAALTYGSFTHGEADEHSDIEYYLYLSNPTAFDLHSWLSTCVRPRLLLTNEFGTHVAILEHLVRAEFHLAPITSMRDVLSWPERRVNVEAMLVKDTTGELRQILEEHHARSRHAPPPEGEVQDLWDRLLNWFAFGSAVLLRGERARALELLGWVQGGLIRLARLHESATQHWLSEKRLLELELSPQAYERYAHCTANLKHVERAYHRAWVWARELLQDLQATRPVDARAEVVVMLDQRITRFE